MRLGRRVKFNMIIAILLCMAFVVNFGSTLANADYNFNASSINKVNNESNEHDAFIDFGSAYGSSGKYIYSPGVYNNQLSIDYGFRQEYDLMMTFTATYTNPNHAANDFSLNFSNRDDWMVDMGSTSGTTSVIDVSADTTTATNTYYKLGASGNSISGVMYYMKTLSDSATLPVISGVSFYTSPNDADEFIGDTLTITLTPSYVKSVKSNYTTSHNFYSSSNNVTLFNNWATYMNEKGTNTTYSTTEILPMVYNAYTGGVNALAFPYDEEVIISGTGEVNTNQNLTHPNYSNTAYRYNISTDGSTTYRTYDAIIAGNKYYGGLGVYIIPTSTLKTISITVPYYWQGAGTTTSYVVTLKYSSDIQTVTINGTDYNYYREKISKPTYINVLEHIMITAEEYSTYIKNGYKLVLDNITVTMFDTSDTTTNWTNNSRESYEIHNATLTSPLLARVEDVYTNPKTYNTNISITNKNTSDLVISKFTISSSLWYSKYTTVGNGTVRKWGQADMGATPYLAEGGLMYDTSLWSVKYETGVFTFSSINQANYIPSGYTMNLISGVTIPQTSACQTATEANDFWCSLQLTSITTTSSDYTGTSTNAIETIVEGYYTRISPSVAGKIYVRNNTHQIITGLTLDENSLILYKTNGTLGLNARDDMSTTPISKTITSHLSNQVSIKPNEMVLAYTITPNDTSVIFSFNLVATLASGKDTSPIDLVYNQTRNYDATQSKGTLINSSNEKSYEFRLVSTTDLTDLLIDNSSFIEVEDTANSKYYYYYKGILCANRCIELLKGFASNVTVDYIEHLPTYNQDRYVASNYKTEWGITSDTDAWLTFMKSLYLVDRNNVQALPQ